MSQNIFDNELMTSRLLLRRLRSSDDKDMYEYTGNHEVTQYLEWKAHTNIDQTKKFIRQVINGYETDNRSYLWAIELINEKKLIGVIRLYDYSPVNKRAEISYILNPGYQGNGYMLESIKIVLNFCFESLDIKRIQAKCVSKHNASVKIMKKAGMLYEGLMKKYFYIKGNEEDASLYAKTK